MGKLKWLLQFTKEGHRIGFRFNTKADAKAAAKRLRKAVVKPRNVRVTRD